MKNIYPSVENTITMGILETKHPELYKKSVLEDSDFLC